MDQLGESNYKIPVKGLKTYRARYKSNLCRKNTADYQVSYTEIIDST